MRKKTGTLYEILTDPLAEIFLAVLLVIPFAIIIAIIGHTAIMLSILVIIYFLIGFHSIYRTEKQEYYKKRGAKPE